MSVTIDECCEGLVVFNFFFFSFQKGERKTAELLVHSTSSIRSNFPGNKSILNRYKFWCINTSASHKAVQTCIMLRFVLSINLSCTVLDFRPICVRLATVTCNSPGLTVKEKVILKQVTSTPGTVHRLRLQPVCNCCRLAVWAMSSIFFSIPSSLSSPFSSSLSNALGHDLF